MCTSRLGLDRKNVKARKSNGKESRLKGIYNEDENIGNGNDDDEDGDDRRLSHSDDVMQR